jgi:hypothetical protein
MPLGTGGDGASVTVSLSSVTNQAGFQDSTPRQKPLFHAGYGAGCVIQNIDYSTIELVAIFGLIEMIIELARLTTICRFGNALDVDLPPSSSNPSVASTPRDDCWPICCAMVLLGCR